MSFFFFKDNKKNTVPISRYSMLFPIVVFVHWQLTSHLHRCCPIGDIVTETMWNVLLVFWSTRCFFLLKVDEQINEWSTVWFFILTGTQAAVCLSERVYWSLQGDVLLNRCDATVYMQSATSGSRSFLLVPNYSFNEFLSLISKQSIPLLCIVNSTCICSI